MKLFLHYKKPFAQVKKNNDSVSKCVWFKKETCFMPKVGITAFSKNAIHRNRIMLRQIKRNNIVLKGINF